MLAIACTCAAECETDLLSDEVIVLLKETFLMLITELLSAGVNPTITGHSSGFSDSYMPKSEEEDGKK